MTALSPKEISALPSAFDNSEILKILTRQYHEKKRGVVLFTDIDKTFYRAGKEAATKKLTQRAHEQLWPIVTLTGNSYEGVMAMIGKNILPYFDIIVGSAGTEIWVLHQTEDGTLAYEKDRIFESLQTNSKFNRQQIVIEAHTMIADFKEKHPEWQFDFQSPEQAELATATSQPFKVSFYFFASTAQAMKIHEQVKSYFLGQTILMCEEMNHNSQLPADAPIKKYCVDIVSSSKGKALQYICNLLGISEGLVAGDSGNDVDMLLSQQGLDSVLVGGYSDEAKLMIERDVFLKKIGDSLWKRTVTFQGEVKNLQFFIENSKQRLAAESILAATEAFLYY